MSTKITRFTSLPQITEDARWRGCVLETGYLHFNDNVANLL